MTAFDPVGYKATTHQQWNAVAERWNAWGPVLDRWLGPATETLLDMAQIGPGARVLHIAGGAGQDAIQSARRVGPSGYVLSTDFSEALTDLARSNFKAAGFANAEARVMDGEEFSLPDLPFDGVVSRVGLIFFPDQEGSVRRQMAVHQAGRPRRCSGLRDRRRVPLFLRSGRHHPPARGTPAAAARPAGPFSLGEPGVIESLFERAGLVDISTRKVPAPLVLDNAAECLRFEQESFGALHQMLSNLDDAGKGHGVGGGGIGPRGVREGRPVRGAVRR